MALHDPAHTRSLSLNLSQNGLALQTERGVFLTLRLYEYRTVLSYLASHLLFVYTSYRVPRSSSINYFHSHDRAQTPLISSGVGMRLSILRIDARGTQRGRLELLSECPPKHHGA